MVPVFPLFGGDQLDSFLQSSQDDQCDEVDEKLAFHHLLGMDSQSVAVDDVLHVIEQQLDVISLPVCIQCFSWILLGIGVQNPVPALPVDERLDLFIFEQYFSSSFRGLPHFEVPVVVRLVGLDGLL